MAGFYRLELEDDIPPFLWTDKMLSNSKICIVLQRISQLIFDLIVMSISIPNQNFTL